MSDEIFDQIEKWILAVDESKTYYVLKLMRLKRISKTQVDAVKIFLGFRRAGVSVVSSTMFAAFRETTPTANIALLHQLGDKGVLTLVKDREPGALRYTLSESFVKHWEEPSAMSSDASSSTGLSNTQV